MRRFCSLLLTIVAALSLGACAVGVKHEYEQLSADIRVKSSQITLAVHDRRPFIVDGSKTEDFVGITRGGYNNPFDAFTASGKPLADDMAKALAASLVRNGTTVNIVRIESKSSNEEAIVRLGQSGQKAILVTLLDWRTSLGGYFFRHQCDLELRVIGANGVVLGQHRLADEHPFPYDPLALPSSVFKREVPPVFKRHMEELFSAPSVAAAL